MTNLRLLCILVVLAAVCWPDVYPQVLKVNNGGPWGEWATDFAMCPKGTYAGGYQVKIESPGGDDTGLNGIRLHCVKKTGYKIKYIREWATSKMGPFGHLCNAKWCHSGYTRFRLKVRPSGGDDTAATNIVFDCKYGDAFESCWSPGGEFGAWSNSCSGDKVICGLRTRVEPNQWFGDDTALNDVEFICCSP